MGIWNGVEWGGNGEGEVSLRAAWDQGGRDRTTQKERFQVSQRGLRKGRNWQGKIAKETSKGYNKGLHHMYSTVIYVCTCIIIYHVNAANKGMCSDYTGVVANNNTIDYCVRRGRLMLLMSSM
jgi:hypothetical protein